MIRPDTAFFCHAVQSVSHAVDITFERDEQKRILRKEKKMLLNKYTEIYDSSYSILFLLGQQHCFEVGLHPSSSQFQVLGFLLQQHPYWLFAATFLNNNSREVRDTPININCNYKFGIEPL